MELSAMPVSLTEHLNELVSRYRVSYQVSRDLVVVDEELRPVGFAIELSATHDHPKHPPTPGCDECVPVALALHEILAGVIPADFRPSQFEVHEARLALRFAPARASGQELTASVEILHRNGAQRPIDDCEVRCRDEILARLKGIGACEGSWHEPRLHLGNAQ